MKYKKFIIKNFKGINELEIDLSKQPAGKIFPLVGLNESGKTTILEAINLLNKRYEDGKEYELIHKKKIGGFTGEISVKAEIELEQNDKEVINEFLIEKNLSQKKEIHTVAKEIRYEFENTKFKILNVIWDILLQIKVPGQKRKYVNLSDYGNNHKVWRELLNKLKENLPEILYFPNFLFEFPEKIYLENIDTLTSSAERKVQEEYKQIIDDILHTINDNYSLDDFLPKLRDLNDSAKQTAAYQIKAEISSTLNQQIVAPWEEIFPGPKKKIIIGTDQDEIGCFIQLKIDEGTTTFLINERSLGFRWFFSFILFTKFRKARTDESGEYLFLFDEPASNLHESSQQKLLSLFEGLTNKSKIIYSTHSPYLINSKLLLNCFVIEDIGRKNDNDYNFKQDIKAIPYRQFVTDYPGKKTHFSPILNVLEYVEHPFVTTKKIVFVEGIFDYYTFKWAQTTLFKDSKDYDFHFYPGAGVNNKYNNIFREYLAHNRKFIAIFDGDDAGKKAKKKSIEEVSIELQDNIFTLSDINDRFAKYTTEYLFTETDRLEIQKNSSEPEPKYNKKKFNAGILKLFIKGKSQKLSEESQKLSDESKKNLQDVLDFIKTKFDEL